MSEEENIFTGCEECSAKNCRERHLTPTCFGCGSNSFYLQGKNHSALLVALNKMNSRISKRIVESNPYLNPKNFDETVELWNGMTGQEIKLELKVLFAPEDKDKQQPVNVPKTQPLPDECYENLFDDMYIKQKGLK